MKNLMVKIKEFVRKNKREQWFKNTVIIVVLLIAAIAADRWRKWDDNKELPQTEIVEEAPEEKPDVLQEIWDDNKAHFIAFGGLSVTLFIVKCRNEARLKESGGNIKE